jgi:hypothetical protein
VGGVGFTITLLVELLGLHRFHRDAAARRADGVPRLRERHLDADVELGRPWMVWMILVSWAPTAALYEVGWCASLYLTVLLIEVAQVPAEELGWGRALRVIRMIYIPVMLLGVTLSHLHQSSWAPADAVIPHKINALWWSDVLPLLFLFSALMAGPALAIARAPRRRALARLRAAHGHAGRLRRIEAWLVALFLAFQLGDLVCRGAVGRHAQLRRGSPRLLGRRSGCGSCSRSCCSCCPRSRRARPGSPPRAPSSWGGVLLHRLNVAVHRPARAALGDVYPALAESRHHPRHHGGRRVRVGVLIRILPIHEELRAPHAAPRPHAAPAGATHARGRLPPRPDMFSGVRIVVTLVVLGKSSS